MNEQITIKELFSLDKTIATGIFEGAVYSLGGIIKDW